MAPVTLNGRTYENVDFLGDGYVGLFPELIFGDMLAELASQNATLNANISAQNANISAKIASFALSGYASTTSLTIGTGARNFVLSQTASISRGTYLAYSAGAPANFMVVDLAAETTSTTAFNTTSRIAVGTGTFAKWVIVPVDAVYRKPYRTITAADTVVASDLGGVINITSGTFTLAFTAAASLLAGFYCTIINTGAGVVTLDPSGAETLDGAATLALSQNQGLTVFCTGSAFLSLESLVRTHALTSHTVSGLTAGHVLRATAANAFAFGALQSTDLPALTRRAERAGRVALWRIARYGR